MHSKTKSHMQDLYGAVVTRTACIKEEGEYNWERMKLNVMHLQKDPSSLARMTLEGLLELG